MSKEFKLIEKIEITNFPKEEVIRVKFIKEFIRLLKEDFKDCRDKTDIWDSERWKKFEKMFMKKFDKRT